MKSSKRPLTGKQKSFADFIASGGSLTDSYRHAYNADNMKPHTVRCEASLLMAHPGVTARVETRRALNERALIACSVSDKDKVLTKLRDMVDNGDSHANQLRAVELLGRTVGIFKSDQEQTDKPRTTAELQKELQEILGQVLDKPGKPQLKAVKSA